MKDVEGKHTELSEKHALHKKKSSFAVIEYQKEAAEYKEKVAEVERRTQSQMQEMQKRMEGALSDHVEKEKELRILKSETDKEKLTLEKNIEDLVNKIHRLEETLEQEREESASMRSDSSKVEEWKLKVENIEMKLADVKKTDKLIISEITQSSQEEVLKFKRQADEQMKITVKALERLRLEERRSDRFREETRQLKFELNDKVSQITAAKAQIQQLAQQVSKDKASTSSGVFW